MYNTVYAVSFEGLIFWERASLKINFHIKIFILLIIKLNTFLPYTTGSFRLKFCTQLTIIVFFTA